MHKIKETSQIAVSVDVTIQATTSGVNSTSSYRCYSSPCRSYVCDLPSYFTFGDTLLHRPIQILIVFVATNGIITVFDSNVQCLSQISQCESQLPPLPPERPLPPPVPRPPPHHYRWCCMHHYHRSHNDDHDHNHRNVCV